MCEPHSDGGRGNSASPEACTCRHHQPSAQPTTTHIPTTDLTTPSNTATTSTSTSTSTTAASRPGSAPWITSPISPPTSPPHPSSCLGLQPTQHHPVDMLAFRFRNQSLIPPPNSSSTSPCPSAALSPASLSSDDFLAPIIVPDDTDSMPMQVDEADDALTLAMPSRYRRRAYRHGLGTEDSSPNPGPSGVAQLSPTADDGFPINELGSSSTSRTFYGPEFDTECPEIEADEGFFEEGGDRSWLESVMSIRQAATGNIKKRYGLKYRSSSEAASRCKNAVHTVPRMRRRDKKHRKRLESDLSGPGNAAAAVTLQ